MEPWERAQREQLEWEARQEDAFFRRIDGSTSMTPTRRKINHRALEDEEFKKLTEELRSEYNAES